MGVGVFVCVGVFVSMCCVTFSLTAAQSLPTARLKATTSRQPRRSRRAWPITTHSCARHSLVHLQA